MLDHERQRRRGVGHRVRAVEDDEAVIAVVVVGDGVSHLRPVVRPDIRGVDERREGQHIDIDIAGKQFGYKRLERIDIRRA